MVNYFIKYGHTLENFELYIFRWQKKRALSKNSKSSVLLHSSLPMKSYEVTVEWAANRCFGRKFFILNLVN
jgi:hypothetical protein